MHNVKCNLIVYKCKCIGNACNTKLSFSCEHMHVARTNVSVQPPLAIASYDCNFYYLKTKIIVEELYYITGS